MDMLDRETIEAQRQEWLDTAEQLRERLLAMNEEVNKIQQQLMALEGANQACQVFLARLGVTDDVEPADA